MNGYGDGPNTSNVVHNNLDPADLPENLGDAIPLIADQADLPLPDGQFTAISGKGIQISLPSGAVPPPNLRLKTFKEWYRIMKSGGTLKVSIANQNPQDVIADLTDAGFSNSSQVAGQWYPPASFIYTATKN